MEYMALMKDPSLQPLWKRGFGNEVGYLFQGIHEIPGTDTCFFVKHTNIPKDAKITCGNFFLRLQTVKLLPLPPPCAPARTHGQIQAPREPPN
jgi:hypothetical protein